MHLSNTRVNPSLTKPQDGILEVPETASASQIRDAYKRYLTTFHPRLPIPSHEI
jgi:hypothetical protein